MRIFNFASRSFKEIIRDPLSLIFAILLPLFLLFIFSQFDIPSEVYSIENFTPGIIVFSFAFVTMFTSTLVSKDRSTSLLTRLAVSPMRDFDYVIGYTVAVLPLVLVQSVLFFSLALIVGLDFSLGIIFTVLVSLPISLMFIGLGILMGSVTSERSSAGVSSIVVQLVAFTSGMYFDSAIMGKFFSTVSDILPFSHALKILKAVLNRDLSEITNSALILIIYTVTISAAAIFVFRKNMLDGQK